MDTTGFLFICVLFSENFTARFPIEVESLIPKYLSNAIVALFFHILTASSQQKINIFWIFFFSGVCTNSVSFWSFLLGQTQADLGGGFVQKKSRSHFPMCDAEAAKPYPQNNLPILLG
jgi:hypothetical protein